MRGWLIGMLLLASSLSAEAATVVAVPEAELVALSDTIVFGSVLRTRTLVNSRGAVVTRADLQVVRAVRGAAAGAVLTLEVPGGRLPNGMVAYTGGSPSLAVGDLVFGFLQTRNGIVRPLGLSYGLLRARSDGAGGYRLFREVEGLVPLDAKGAELSPASISLKDVALDELIARVERRLIEIGVPVGGGEGGGEVHP